MRLLSIASSQQRSSSTRLNEHPRSARESAVVEHGRDASAALGRSSSVADRQTERQTQPAGADQIICWRDGRNEVQTAALRQVAGCGGSVP